MVTHLLILLLPRNAVVHWQLMKMIMHWRCSLRPLSLHLTGNAMLNLKLWIMDHGCAFKCQNFTFEIDNTWWHYQIRPEFRIETPSVSSKVSKLSIFMWLNSKFQRTREQRQCNCNYIINNRVQLKCDTDSEISISRQKKITLYFQIVSISNIYT